jgi:hypothetical protein
MIEDKLKKKISQKNIKRSIWLVKYQLNIIKIQKNEKKMTILDELL